MTTKTPVLLATGTARGTVLHLVPEGGQHTLCGQHTGRNVRHMHPGFTGILDAREADCVRCLRQAEHKTSAPPKVRLRGTDRWVSCGITEFGPIGEYRHIVAAGGITTVCGATASTPDVWRANRNKPRCPSCSGAYNTPRENR